MKKKYTPVYFCRCSYLSIPFLPGKLLAPITVNGKTYAKDDYAYEPFLTPEFWTGNMERVRSFEKGGEVDIYGYGCLYHDGAEISQYRDIASNKPRVLMDGTEDTMSGSYHVRATLLLMVACYICTISM